MYGASIIADQRMAARFAQWARVDLLHGALASATRNQDEAAYYAAHARRIAERDVVSAQTCSAEDDCAMAADREPLDPMRGVEFPFADNH